MRLYWKNTRSDKTPSLFLIATRTNSSLYYLKKKTYENLKIDYISSTRLQCLNYLPE